MTFKEFVCWCNDRAFDGCWGPQTAIVCIHVMEDVRSQKPWRRKKRWRELTAGGELFSIIKSADTMRHALERGELYEMP